MRHAATTTMVGRRTELDTLLDALDDGRAGTPRAVLVRGEAGIGKTRLVQEFLAAAAARTGDRPLAVAIGQCVDLGPIGAPFGPIRRVLRDIRTEVGTEALADAAGSPAVLAALAALVPGIADVDASDDHVGEFAAAFEVVLENLSIERHLVVVIEDLQWADAATFALLRTVASSLRGRHLTIVATYRSDDIDRFHPLHPVLAELDRTRGIRHIDLTPLSPSEVAEQVGMLRAGELTAGQIDLLTERSGGVPFLVEELVDLGDRGLPDTLRDLVLARYTRLGGDAQRTIRLMSAAGVHVDHDALAAVSDLDEAALDLALREAIDARIVVADGAGYTFRHALTQEAVASEMLPSERVRTHRGYAAFLAAHRSADSPDDVSAVAEHWLAARDLPAAFDATVVALRLSRASFAPATSAKLAERLTELWEQVPDAATRAGTTLAAIHLEASQAWHDIGESTRALRAANEGLAVCPDEPMLRAALLRQRFVEVFNSEHRDRREDIVEAAALLEGIDEPRALALRSRIMSNFAISEKGTDAAEHAAAAISLAEAAGDDAALAVALVIESWRRSDEHDDEPGALPPLERARGLRLDPAMRAYVGIAHLALLCRLGRYREARELGEQHLSEAARAGIERGMGSSLMFLTAMAALGEGRPEIAVPLARRARRTTDPKMRRHAVSVIGTQLAWDDRDAERAELLSTETARSADADDGSMTVIDEAEAAAELGAAVASARAHEALGPVLAAAQSASVGQIRRTATAAAALLLRSGAGSAIEREAVRDALTSWPDHDAAAATAGFVEALVDDDPPATRIPRLREVIASAVHLHIAHRRVAEFLLAEALVADGARAEAAEILSRIAEHAPHEGLARIARWARELSARAGLDAAASPSTLPLTPREEQVLALVAEGLTNAQIGQRLFISPKTASVHVSAILAKVGAANRAEAAVIYSMRDAPARSQRDV